MALYDDALRVSSVEKICFDNSTFLSVLCMFQISILILITEIHLHRTGFIRCSATLSTSRQRSVCFGSDLRRPYFVFAPWPRKTTSRSSHRMSQLHSLIARCHVLHVGIRLFINRDQYLNFVALFTKLPTSDHLSGIPQVFHHLLATSPV